MVCLAPSDPPHNIFWQTAAPDHQALSESKPQSNQFAPNRWLWHETWQSSFDSSRCGHKPTAVCAPSCFRPEAATTNRLIGSFAEGHRRRKGRGRSMLTKTTCIRGPTCGSAPADGARFPADVAKRPLVPYTARPTTSPRGSVNRPVPHGNSGLSRAAAPKSAPSRAIAGDQNILLQLMRGEALNFIVGRATGFWYGKVSQHGS